MPTTAVLSRRQWRALLPLGVAMLLSLSGDLTLYAILPARAAALGLSLSTVGLILSANRLVRLLTNPAAGLLLDRWGRRPIVLFGLALGVLSTLGYLDPRAYGLFLLARLLWGTCWSLIYVGGHTMVVDVTTQVDRGRVTGLLQVFYFAGLSLNPLLGGLLSDCFGFRPALTLSALLAALGLLIALAFLPETRPVHSLHPRKPCYVQPWPNLAGLRGLLAGRAQILAAGYLYMLASFAGEGVVMSTISLHLQRRYGDQIALGSLSWPIATVGGALLALRAALSAIAAPIAGHISDRRRQRWAAVQWGVIAGVAGMGLAALPGGPYTLVLGVSLIALSGGIVTTLLPALVGDSAPAGQRGAALGALMVAGDLGCAVAPLAAYAALATLSTEAVYAASALILATGLALPSLSLRESEATTDRPAPQ